MHYSTAKVLIFILSITSLDAFSQSFKTDWKNFKPPINWSVNFFNKSDCYLGEKTQGELVFKNEVDTNLKISYQVFLDFQIDSNFTKKVKHDQLINTTIRTVNFNSFVQNGFYYLSLPCNNCLTSAIGSRPVNAKNKAGKPLNNCELLAFEILKFTQIKQNKF